MFHRFLKDKEVSEEKKKTVLSNVRSALEEVLRANEEGTEEKNTKGKDEEKDSTCRNVGQEEDFTDETVEEERLRVREALAIRPRLGEDFTDETVEEERLRVREALAIRPRLGEDFTDETVEEERLRVREALAR